MSMRKILLIGNCPLPDENVKMRPAAGLRTWQFLKGLEGGSMMSDGGSAFEIRSVLIAMPECYGGRTGLSEAVGLPGQTLQTEDGLNSGTDGLHVQNFESSADRIIRISKNDLSLLQKIQTVHDEFMPEVIVAVNTYPSYIACKLKSLAPLWADLNGWIMAEAQAQAYKMGSNDYLEHYMEMESVILQRADKFSTVSEAQSLAVLGELAGTGRLNAESFGYEFCHAVRNGSEVSAHVGTQISQESVPVRTLEEVDASAAENLFRDVPGNAFVLLWMGGYNTWVDEVTLFKGVEAAMRECEKLYFVSTGGEIEGLDNKTFASFRLLINGSPFRDRFIFLGWVETKLIPYIYKRANAGINIDRMCAETMTGARNRINEMMAFGLPVITTLGSEISYEVVRAGAGIGVKSGRYDELAAAIKTMYSAWRSGASSMTYGEAGKKYIQDFCNYEKTLEPLLRWLENPRPAPDRGMRRDGLSGGQWGRLSRGLRGGLRYLRENGLKKFSKKFWQKIKN